MDNSMYTATAELITERVNFHGQHSDENVDGATHKLCATVTDLRETFNEKQDVLFRKCENAYGEADAET